MCLHVWLDAHGFAWPWRKAIGGGSGSG